MTGLRVGLGVLSLLSVAVAFAAEVSLAGVMGRRATLVVDGGAPQTVAPGGLTREGVRLVALREGVATVEVEGRRETIRIGERVAHSSGGGADKLLLQADARGHFVTSGRVNGLGAQFLIDTGATLVSMGRNDAERAGLDYRKGTVAESSTANGVVRIWRVQIDSLEVGGLKFHNVDAAIHENDLPVNLLGMSFLNRTQWQRDGDKLILQKRY